LTGQKDGSGGKLFERTRNCENRSKYQEKKYERFRAILFFNGMCMKVVENLIKSHHYKVHFVAPPHASQAPLLFVQALLAVSE